MLQYSDWSTYSFWNKARATYSEDRGEMFQGREFKKFSLGAGEMAQWPRALAALPRSRFSPQDPCGSSQLPVHNSSSAGSCTNLVHIHTGKIKTGKDSSSGSHKQHPPHCSLHGFLGLSPEAGSCTSQSGLHCYSCP